MCVDLADAPGVRGAGDDDGNRRSPMREEGFILTLSATREKCTNVHMHVRDCVRAGVDKPTVFGGPERHISFGQE